MNNKKILLGVFVLVALIQLFVPANMIWSREKVLSEGTEYKFKTAPIDPNDPFRGKYISLNFEQNTIEVENADDWIMEQEVYAILTKDEDGYAKISSVEKERPDGEEEYVQAKAFFVSFNDSNKLSLEFPFDRFYMEESKAYDAELVYRESQIDSSQVTYALVSIKNGEAVLKDVMIDGVSIKEIVKSNKDREAEEKTDF